MRKLTHLFIGALCFMGVTQPVWAVQQELPLARVAASAGLTYSWLSAERAVSLMRPGIVIVIRPGQSLYEVNDRVESSATAPRYANNDIYVSASFAEHITQLARQAQLRSQDIQNLERAYGAAAAPTAPAVSGSISLDVHPLQGSEAVIVTGHAPPTAPVMITLLATLSSDLPTVVVSRHNISADPDGKFQAIIPIAADFLRGSYLKVLATSVPSVVSASAQVLVGPPSPGLKVPADPPMGSIW
ncbi:MAG: stalk domain-containing protein [Vulcanimicrobiaceae bacterium]